MQIKLLKSKIHRARVTSAIVDYEGSITIDKNLMDAAALIQHEHVHVWDATNGERVETYAVAGKRGSREVQMNGAAARLIKKGHIIIIASFALMSEKEVGGHHPKIVIVDKLNRVKKIIIPR